MFKGFSDKTSEFLWELSFNNERPWFQEHKQEFEEYMNRPFRENAKAVYEIMSERFPDADWQVHISRIYRDARRLYGKPPFNDHLWFTLWTGDIDNHGPCFWFELGKSDYGCGMGFWETSAAHMAAYRAAIDANPAGFETMAKSVTASHGFILTGEQYKKPKADRGEYLNLWYNRRHVGLQLGDDFGGIVLSPELPMWIADVFTDLKPMYDFLAGIYRNLQENVNE